MSDDGNNLSGLPESPFDRLDPGAAEADAARREAERKAEDRRLFLRRLLSDPEGRLWLWEQLEYAHAFEVRFASTGAAPDPMGSWLYAGQQNVGWHLWEQLDAAAPDLAGEMRRARGVPG